MTSTPRTAHRTHWHEASALTAVPSMVPVNAAASGCTVPEKIRTHPMGGHWKFLGGEGS